MRRLFALSVIVMAALGVMPTHECRASSGESGAKSVADTVMMYDVYDFYTFLKVPQVRDNSTSQGKRKFETQKIKGEMLVLWMADGEYRLEFRNLVNKHFKVGGAYVTYTAETGDGCLIPRFCFIGSNKTLKFDVSTIAFPLTLEPSYAIGEPTEDNSFNLYLAGKGTSKKIKSSGCVVAYTLSGHVAGTQGCGCADYGHVSPTRGATACGPGCDVSDVVATYGSWKAKWKSRITCK